MNKTKRTLQGKVVRKSSNTLRVSVETKQAHPLYGKVMKSHSSYLVHCPKADDINVGDLVNITETRPISKLKSWRFVSKVN